MRGETDMSNVKEGGSFDPIPEGLYKLCIEEIEPKTTKNNDPMAGLTMTVVGGEFAGRKVWDNIIIPEDDSPAIKIKGRTMHFLHCIDEPYEGKFAWDSDNWIGKTLFAKIWHETYEGKVRSKISEYLLPEDVEDVKKDDADSVPF